MTAVTGADGKPVMVDQKVETQTIPQGPCASQTAIKMFGLNGDSFFNANAAHPFENPTPLSNFVQMLCILLIPAGLVYYYGKQVNHLRHGWAIWAAMGIICVSQRAGALVGGGRREPHHAPGRGQRGRREYGRQGGALRDHELVSVCQSDHRRRLRRGELPARFAYSLGGLIPIFNIHLGEIIFGGVGSGLYGMLVFIAVTVFICG